MSGDIQRALFVSVGALVEELVRSGVRHFSVCPGSRSTPLALTIARQPGARLWMHLDERSAGFFGLGLAKASLEPVAIVCTSGTAAANFLPAVVEAFNARVPLVVLTADRPHELRDCGAPQTIDQIGLFGSHVKWFVDLPEPEATPDLVRYVRTIACRAVATARRGPSGPVNLNCPFREPLIPVPDDGPAGAQARAAGVPYVSVATGVWLPTAEQVDALAQEVARARRGLIVYGPQPDPDLAAGVARLAAAAGYPILADPLSGARCGDHDRTQTLDCYDAFLRDRDLVERLAPELVIRLGAMPTSKPVLLYLQRHAGCRQVVVDGDGGWREPTQLAAEMIHAEPRPLCDAVAAALPRDLAGDGERTSWVSEWCRADRRARSAIQGRLDEMHELFEGKVFAELAELLPDGAALFAGNSMPVRDLDTFFPGSRKKIRFLANRGANGIDGVVSTALGAAAAGEGPLVLVIGDLSFYHDSNGLLAARRHNLNATIVLLNNDGGGIFSFLPQAAQPEHFEELFGTPHGLDFRPLAEMHGARFTRVAGWGEFGRAVAEGVAKGGLNVVEVPTGRGRNVALHREVWRAVSADLAGTLGARATG